MQENVGSEVRTLIIDLSKISEDGRRLILAALKGMLISAEVQEKQEKGA